MKFKITADSKDMMTFGVYAVVLLYLIALAVLNIPQLAGQGTFYGLNPIEAFDTDHIKYTLIIYIVCLLGSFLSVKSHFFEFEKGFGLHITTGASGGYSDWAREKDIKTDKNVVRVEANQKTSDAAGVPLICNGHELWVDNGEYHTLVIGATGSGKTQDTILPTIKVLAKKGESIICTDPKGELYEKTAGLLKEKGYNILLLNFRSPQNGEAWNPLSMPYRLYKNGNQDKAIELLDDLAANILYEENSGNQDPFWEKTAADYFAGIALAMFEDTTEDKININSINMTATVGEDKFGGSTYIKEYFNLKDPASPAYVNASGTVMAPSDTKGSIISVFKQKVKLFASRENLSEMLSHSDIELDSIGKQKTAVFIIIQDEKKTYHSLATIFIKQVYETLIDVAQQNGGKLPVRTNFLLDEFANMPPLKDVTTMITAARSRQIRFIMIIQNFAQLNKVYGKDDAETIKGNCGNIIYLISTELAALEEISKLCGEKKSKQDAKTASTPLVTISDLQRMKQFDHIILRMRKSPFKTSFVPDFKIDWGNEKSPKVDYPVRQKVPVAIFDIRDFVKEKKSQKIDEVMANLGGGGGGFPGGFPGDRPPSGGGFFPPRQGSGGGSKQDLSINDIVKKIDAKLAALEKEEEEKKNGKISSEPNKKYDDILDDDIDLIPDDELDTKPKPKSNSHMDDYNNLDKGLLSSSLDDELLDDDIPVSKPKYERDSFDRPSNKYEEHHTIDAEYEDIDSDRDRDLSRDSFMTSGRDNRRDVMPRDHYMNPRMDDHFDDFKYDNRNIINDRGSDYNFKEYDRRERIEEPKAERDISLDISPSDIEKKVNDKLSQDLFDSFDLLAPIEKNDTEEKEEKYTYNKPVYETINKEPAKEEHIERVVEEPKPRRDGNIEPSNKQVFKETKPLTLENIEEDEQFFDDFFDD